MKVSEALIKRKSTRAFLPKEVEREKIDSILNYAKHAPSGVNMQPWSVAVVSGKKKMELEQSLVDAFNNGVKANMDYDYYPRTWVEPYKSRRKETGLLMYETLKISRENREGQKAQWRANYRAFDAPIALFFFIDKDLEKGSFFDYGMFYQSIMLVALEYGLATCPQAALAEYPDIVRAQLGLSNDKSLIAGIALGYEDTKAPINNYRTSRLSLDEFTSYYS